jgi:parvulin-like peptidyl-prolyl isomerase
MKRPYAPSRPVLAEYAGRRTQVLKASLSLVVVVCVSAVSAQQPVASHRTAAAPRAAVSVVARVNGAPITSDRLELALRRLIPFESFHRNVSAAAVDRLRTQALDGLVDEELRYQEGERLGLAPSSAELDAGMKAVVARYASRSEFEQARRASGVSIEDVRREIRRTLVIRKAFERTVTSRCQVGPAEAARYYAANPSRFVVPEQLHVFAITFGVDPGSPARAWTDAKARAEQVLGQIRNGSPFEEMARKHSTDKTRESGGDMGWVHRGSLTDEFEQALRGLKPGDVTPVIQTIYGFHVARIAAIRPPEQKPLDAAAEGIQQDLTKQRCAQTEAAWAAGLRASARIEIVGAAGAGVSRAADVPGGRQ